MPYKDIYGSTVVWFMVFLALLASLIGILGTASFFNLRC